jgi:hypothetical protein
MTTIEFFFSRPVSELRRESEGKGKGRGEKKLREIEEKVSSSKYDA